MVLPPNAGKGRPPGVRNKRTLEFAAVLEAAGFCPATALMDCYKTAMQKFIQECEKEDTGKTSPMESSAAKYLKIAADNASDLASYSYPKLKSLEVKKDNPTDGMSPEQKLEAARLMVQVLERQTGNGPGTSR